MRKTLLALAVAVASTTTLYAQCKINFEGMRILEDYKMHLLDNGNIAHPDDGLKTLSAVSSPEVKAVILLTDQSRMDDFKALGYETSFAKRDIAIATIPLKDVEKLAEYDFIQNITFGTMSRPMLNLAREYSNVDPIQTGQQGLPSAFTGKGVVTSLFDQGLDPNHINFKDSDGNTRVKAVAWYNGNKFQGDYVGDFEISMFSTDDATADHGTHVLGIMAGSYNGPSTYAGGQSKKEGNMPFYGVATESDIVIGCGTFYDSNILDGVGYAMSWAEELNEPIVVNLSLGSNSGPHDPLSATNRTLDLYGEDAIICVAAGNEGDEALGIMKTFTADDNELKTFIGASQNPGRTAMNGSIGFYSSTKTPLEFSVVIFNALGGDIIYELPINASTGASSVFLAGSQYSPGKDYNRSTYFDQTFTPTSYLSVQTNVPTDIQRYAVKINCNLSYSASSNYDYILGFVIKGAPGVTVNGYSETSSSNSSYIAFRDEGFPGWQAGSCNGSINSMACGNNVIAIGSYNTRKSFYKIGGGPYSYTGENPVGQISTFSSYGTLNDGRNLPVVCAPGCVIMSSESLFYYNTVVKNQNETVGYYISPERPNYWTYMQGTSMASPFAAGTFALWLEADPTLKVADVIDIVKATAVKDNDVAKGDPVQWGAGKLDALAGIKEVINRAAGVGSVFADQNKRFLFRPLGDNKYNVFVEGEEAINVRLYTTAGNEVKLVKGDSNDVTLDASGLSTGVYLLSVEGKNCARYTEKIVVK